MTELPVPATAGSGLSPQCLHETVAEEHPGGSNSRHSVLRDYDFPRLRWESSAYSLWGSQEHLCAICERLQKELRLELRPRKKAVAAQSVDGEGGMGKSDFFPYKMWRIEICFPKEIKLDSRERKRGISECCQPCLVQKTFFLINPPFQTTDNCFPVQTLPFPSFPRHSWCFLHQLPFDNCIAIENDSWWGTAAQL